MTNLKKISGIISLVILSVSLQCCATAAANKSIDAKLAAEPQIDDSKSLGIELESFVKHSKKLTVSQKEQLLQLHKESHAQMAQLREESLKLRSILIKDVIQSKYNMDEIELVKERLKKVEDKRLTVIFNTVDHANTIIGNELPENEAILRQFYEVRVYN